MARDGEQADPGQQQSGHQSETMGNRMLKEDIWIRYGEENGIMGTVMLMQQSQIR